MSALNRHVPAVASDDEDAWHDPLMRIVMVILLLATLIFVAGLGVVYWGDSYAVPSWDERSVPPPSID
jgi:hypothetical protein